MNKEERSLAVAVFAIAVLADIGVGIAAAATTGAVHSQLKHYAASLAGILFFIALVWWSFSE